MLGKLKPLLLFTLILTACAQQPPVASSGGRLTFIHLNDTYRIDAVESGGAGGFGRVVTLLRQLSAEGRDVRILHGGDFLYPSLESQLWNGMQMVDAFNFMDALAPMYVVAGNHEFDRRTPEPLVDAVRASEFDWLGDNYEFRTGDSHVDSALKSQFVLEHGEHKIGFFALTLHSDHGGNDRDYAPISNRYTEIAERSIRQLEDAGVDLIVGLTHLHIWQDQEVAKLKADHPRFLLVAGGHEHEPEHHDGTFQTAAIVKGASNARIIWRIDITFNDDGVPRVEKMQEIVLDGAIASDPMYDALVSRWRNQLLEKFPFLEATVGEAAVPLDGREVTIRNSESNWGNYVVDQMRGAFGEPAADLAFINSGTLRIDDFISGDIQFEDIGRTFGFSSELRYLTVSGAEFRQILEAGYRGAGPSKGYFPQVSGFRVCVDRSRAEGSRIVSLQIPAGTAWRDIAVDDEYTLVVPDFLYRGGDGYEFPPERAASRPGSELKYRVLDAIMAAQAQGRKVGAAVDPKNPRIVLLEQSDDACFN